MGMRERVTRAGLLAALALTMSASPTSASVPIGQLAEIPSGSCGGDIDWVQLSVLAGDSYTVPGNGTITSWSTRGPAAGHELTMKVFRQVSGVNYSVVGHDGPRPLSAGSVNTFATSVPVQAGDLLGLQTVTAGFNCLNSSGAPGDTYLIRLGSLADGSSGDFMDNGGDTRRVNIAAVFDYSNTFSFGPVTRNKRKGTASVTVRVPNPGELTLSGNGVKTANAAAAGDVDLPIRVQGKKQKKLKRKGKVAAGFTVTYTPTGGEPAAQSMKVKLKNKRKKKR
jgi:hypothetical protein